MASTGLPDGAQTSYFVNQSEIPQGATGLVRPNAAGIGLNRVMAPPPPPPRQMLAQQMQRPQQEMWRGARGMGGAFGNGYGGGVGGNTPGGRR
jgi:hypothetical protein